MFVKGKKYRVMTLEELKATPNVCYTRGAWRYGGGGDCISDAMVEYLGKTIDVFACPMFRNNNRIRYATWNFDYWMFKEIDAHKTTRLLKAVLNEGKEC